MTCPDDDDEYMQEMDRPKGGSHTDTHDSDRWLDDGGAK